MSCFCISKKNKIHCDNLDDLDNINQLTNKNKSYKDETYQDLRKRLKQRELELDKFLSERIMCFNCRKIYTLKENKIIMECAGCEKMFCCGIGGECRGYGCRVTLGDKVCYQRYCKKCIIKKTVNNKTILYCQKCY